MAKKVTIKNFSEVMDNIKLLFEKSDIEEKEIWCSDLNEMLDNQLNDDFFGTEGQLDPRGDQRDY